MATKLQTQTQTQSNNNSVVTVIGYATDVEGNYSYWCRYVELSHILKRVPKAHHHDFDNIDIEYQGQYDEDHNIKESDNVTFDCHFVFGGDSVDRGIGDLRFLRELLSLKRRYPNNVHLILGNRDVNKMRFTSELGYSFQANEINDVIHNDDDNNNGNGYSMKKGTHLLSYMFLLIIFFI